MTSEKLNGTGEIGQSPNKFCVWCGHQFLDDARYCTDCGRSIADSVRIPSSPPAEWVDSHTTAEIPAQRVPESLPATMPQPLPDTRVRRTRIAFDRNRWLYLSIAAVAALVVIALVATMAYRSMRDRPIHQALDAAEASFGAGVDQLSTATDLQQIDAAGERLAAAQGTLQTRERELAGPDSDLGRAAHRVVAAQVAFAAAAAELGDVSSTEFTWWGPLHERLVRADQELGTAIKALDATDGDAASAVTSTHTAVTALETVIGARVVDAAGQRLDTMLDSLGSATNTQQLRSAAAVAAKEAAAVAAAQPSMTPGSADAGRLATYAAVFPQLAKLAVLDADHLGSWAALRSPVVTALTGAGSDVIDPAARQSAVSNIDQIVRRGKAAMADWRTAYQTAVADRAHDLRGLRDYRSQMDGQLATYSALRGELSDWVDMVANPSSYVTYEDAYRELSRASSERYDVREKMSSLAIPSEVMAAHRELVGVVDDGISAVDSAYEGLSNAEYCMDGCYYRDTDAWQRFSSESRRITGAYDAALASWRSSVEQADQAIAGRALPRQPVV